jgi:hypothetical protein
MRNYVLIKKGKPTINEINSRYNTLARNYNPSSITWFPPLILWQLMLYRFFATLVCFTLWSFERLITLLYLELLRSNLVWCRYIWYLVHEGVQFKYKLKNKQKITYCRNSSKIHTHNCSFAVLSTCTLIKKNGGFNIILWVQTSPLSEMMQVFYTCKIPTHT